MYKYVKSKWFKNQRKRDVTQKLNPINCKNENMRNYEYIKHRNDGLGYFPRYKHNHRFLKLWEKRNTGTTNPSLEKERKTRQKCSRSIYHWMSLSIVSMDAKLRIFYPLIFFLYHLNTTITFPLFNSLITTKKYLIWGIKIDFDYCITKR